MYFNAIQLTRIQMGGIICMPAILAGYWLEQQYQLGGAMLALFFGNIVLWGLSLCMLRLSLVKRYTTTECCQALLGRTGAVACAIAYLIALVGWFAINQHMMISQMFALWGFFEPWAFYLGYVILGLLNIYFVQKGIEKIEVISRMIIPVMLCILIGFLYQSIDIVYTSKINSVFYFSALLFVINLSLGMVFDIPTYYRSAKNMKEGVLSLTVLFWVFIPLVECIGVFMGASHPLGEKALFQTHSLVLKGIYTSFMLFACFMTNNCNLYSAVANSAIILPVDFKTRVLLLGTIGIMLSFVDVWSRFDFFLNIMTRCMVVIGALLLFIYLKKGRSAFESEETIR